MIRLESKNTVILERGVPQPLGVTSHQGSWNFALFSKHATEVNLCLYRPGSNETAPDIEVKFHSDQNRTGRVWHGMLIGEYSGWRYGFRVNGSMNGSIHPFDTSKVLLDPYAPTVCSHEEWGDPQVEQNGYAPKGVVCDPIAFDWEKTSPPRHELQNLVIYEAHVRGFTRDPSSQVAEMGTFSGMIEKIPYLKKLGVNAIELLPVHEFNEMEMPRINPESGERLVNYWGYSTVNFFSPMRRYSGNSDAINEFRKMVREMHRNGIEVILDVVFNHTAEGNELGPTLSFRGLDNSIYYILNQDGKHMNYSGCGNTFNCNHTIVRDLILQSLRYWVMEMRVDGFRFDLASILGRSVTGEPMPYSPLIDAISHDPILADTKLIAEAWDAGGLYQVGSFYPEYGRWAEWNGSFRDIVRKFIKGTDGVAGPFATKLAGSEDLYGQSRAPYHSVNFITAHDGFTLNDLVSYNHKRNFANGEENQDGCNENESWNCGIEGKTKGKEIIALRERQMRNLILALMVSQGVPMILMGDEYAHTKLGNNNTWCHDNRLNWFCWDQLEKNSKQFKFFQKAIEFRKMNTLVRKTHFMKFGEVDWRNADGTEHQWETTSRFVSYLLKGERDLFIAFNADYREVEVTIPEGRWNQIFNTSLGDFEGQMPVKAEVIMMKPYSSLILKQVEN
jgi:isoamylase